MKKYLILLAILMSAAVKTYAQNDNTQTKIGVGFSGGGVLGSLSTFFPFAGELNVRAEFPLKGSPVSITVTTGLTFYVSPNGYDTYNDINGEVTSNWSEVFLPVQAGARIYATHSLFLEGDLGGSFNFNPASTNAATQKVAFIFTPQAGYTIPFGRSRASLDLSLFYENRVESVDGYSQVGGRVVFNFGLK